MAAKNNWRRYGTKLRHCHPRFLGSTSLHLQKDIDWFSRSALLTCLASAQYTDTRTTLRRTRVGKGDVYALHAGDAPTKKTDCCWYIKRWDKKVSKTRHFTVNLLRVAASKNSGKNLCCVLKIDITSVIDVDENEHASRRCAVVFFVLIMKFMTICHCLTNVNASFIIYHKFSRIIVRKRLPTAFVSLYT